MPSSNPSLPSGNQIWQREMDHLFIADFPINTSIHRGFSSQPCLITRGKTPFGGFLKWGYPPSHLWLIGFFSINQYKPFISGYLTYSGNLQMAFTSHFGMLGTAIYHLIRSPWYTPVMDTPPQRLSAWSLTIREPAGILQAMEGKWKGLNSNSQNDICMTIWYNILYILHMVCIYIYIYIHCMIWYVSRMFLRLY